MRANQGLGRWAGLALIVAASVTAGCSDSQDTASSTTASTGVASSGAGGSGAGTGGAGTGGGGAAATGGGGAASAPTVVVAFDPTKGELPEGLWVDGQTAYLGFAPTGAIITVDLASGTVTPFGQIPGFPTMNGPFLLGIAKDAQKNVYVGSSYAMSSPPPGIYRFPAGGGMQAAPWASDAMMGFPNGLVFDSAGNLLVSDSEGTIFKVDGATATVSTWLSDPSLSGTGSTCASMAPLPIGTNGIALGNGVLYSANTNFGRIVAIPVDAAGNAGAPTVLVEDCDKLAGIDGITLDDDGTILGVVNTQNKLVRIDTSGKVTDLYVGKPLDTPASVSIANVSGKKVALITNAAFFDATAPAPGLLSFPLP